MFEMATGCELKMLEPDPNDYIFINKNLGNVLKQIFPEQNATESRLLEHTLLCEESRINDLLNNDTKVIKKFCYPNITIEEILSHDFFDSHQDIIKTQTNLRNIDQISKSIIKSLNKLNYQR